MVIRSHLGVKNVLINCTKLDISVGELDTSFMLLLERPKCQEMKTKVGGSE